MKFDIAFERTYPHPPEKLWRALTERHLLGQWLMETDFAAEQGHSFSMWCADGKGGTDHYLCRLLEFEPPRRMVWSWLLDGRQQEGETRVEFELKQVADGTHLTIRHSGDRSRETIEAFKGGWPVKLDQLGEALRAAGAAR